MDQYMEPDKTNGLTVQNDLAEVRLSTVPIRTSEPCTVSTRLHSEWSFSQIHDQMSELTVPELVLPNHPDKLKPTAEPDLTWFVRFPKMVTTSLSWAVWCVPSVLKTELMDCLSCPTH